MARIASDITWLVGNTPLLELTRLNEPGRRLLAKLEAHSPGGSNKDRGVLEMIREAERCGFLRDGGTIVECSGGDLGISIATIGRALGYRVILTMPTCMGGQRCNLLRALGAEVVLTPTEEGIRAAMDRAEALAKEIDGGLCLQPFSNRANLRAHRRTAQEIWHDTDGQVDVVVCPIGTGGTAAGIGGWYKEFEPDVRVIGVEPSKSPVITGGSPGNHNIPGIGAGFVPDILDPSLLSEVVVVSDEDAMEGVRRLSAECQLLAGPAGGAVLAAARNVPPRGGGGPPVTVVCVIPDSADRYFEHPAFQELGGAS